MNNDLTNKKDYDAMKFTGGFATGIWSRILTSSLRKATGLNIGLKVRRLEGSIVDNRTRIHLDIDAEMSEEELNKLFKQLGI